MSPQTAIGARVGAICKADDSTVWFYGFGVYDGYFLPPQEVKFMGVAMDRENPRITLDDGKIVWGCECWWGPEQKIKDIIGLRTIIPVDIEAARKESNEH